MGEALRDVAVTITSMWIVAVVHAGVSLGRSSQSSRPVIAVGAARIKPKEIASSDPCAICSSCRPSAPARRMATPTVWAPMLASVSGGCSGLPGNRPFPQARRSASAERAPAISGVIFVPAFVLGFLLVAFFALAISRMYLRRIGDPARLDVEVLTEAFEVLVEVQDADARVLGSRGNRQIGEGEAMGTV